jgi:hypothetical protein
VLLSFATKASSLTFVEEVTVGEVAVELFKSMFPAHEPLTIALPAESALMAKMFSRFVPPNCRAQTYEPVRVSFTT